MPHTRRTLRHLALSLAVALAAIGSWSALPLGASGQDAGQVQQQIDAGKAKEQQLSAAAERLARLEQVVRRGVLVLRRQQESAQVEVDLWQERLTATERRLRRSRMRLADQERRLRRDRQVLAANLRASYVRGTPDLLSVAIGARDFSELVDQVRYESETRTRNAQLLRELKGARARTTRLEREQTATVREQRLQATALARERNAIAQRAAALAEREATLAQARAARQAALASTRSSRKRAERTLRRLQAAQDRVAVDRRGPGGPWAIPWAVVRCESGGRTFRPTPREPPATTSSCQPPGGRWVAAPRMPTRPARPSRIAWRRSSGMAGAALATGCAPRSSGSSSPRSG